MEIIKDGLKEQFAKNIQLVIQQEGSILKNTITIGSQDTEIASFESMGSFEAQTRTRHAIQVDGQDSLYGHYSKLEAGGKFDPGAAGNKVDFYAAKISRRYLGAAAYHWSATMDRNDKLNLLADPTTHFPKMAGWAMGRKQDALIIKAFADPVKAGRTGTETINFDVTNNVVSLGLSFTVTGDNKDGKQETKAIDPANTNTVAALAHAEVEFTNNASRIHSNSKLVTSGGAGLTVQKLIRAKHILNKGLLGRPNKFYLFCSQQQITDLLKDTRIQSIDYNTVRALVAGEVNSFMGFTFVVSEMLGGVYDHEAVEGKRYATRDCYAYTDTSIRFHTVNGSIEKEITKLIEYHNNYFMYYSEAFGATRDNEKSVVCIKCLEDYDASIHDNAVNPQWITTADANHQRALHSTVVPWQMFGVECKSVDNQQAINDAALEVITEKNL